MPQPSTERRARLLILTVAAVLVAFVFGLLAGGELGDAASAGIETVPLFVLAALVQLARPWRTVRILAWAWFWLLLVALAAFSMLITVAALDAEPLLPGERAVRVGLMAGAAVASLAVAATVAATPLWLSAGRALGARHLVDSLGYRQGVVGLLAFVLLSVAPFAATGGQAPLLALVDQGDVSGRSASVQVLDLFYGLAWTIPLAFLFAGLPVLRGPRAALEWLGVGRLPWRSVLVVCGVGVGLVGVGFLVDNVTQLVWGWAGWPLTNAEAVSKLFEATNSPMGAVAVGVTAGVGEELMARGVLQPRFGWLLPNLAFAGAHAFQYGPDGVLSVFVIGGVQAAVRARWNTTAAVTTHGLYDFLLVLGGALGWPGF